MTEARSPHQIILSSGTRPKTSMESRMGANSTAVSPRKTMVVNEKSAIVRCHFPCYAPPPRQPPSVQYQLHGAAGHTFNQ